MTGEVISIHIGQAGVQMGHAIWELLKVEHEIDRQGNLLCFCPWPLEDNIDSLFYETSSGKYCPRSLFIDSDPNVIDEMLCDLEYNNIPSSNIIRGIEESYGNFGRGYHIVGQELIDKAMCVINKLFENTNNLSGVMIFHSLSGGTGSGLSCKIVEKFKENNLKVPIINFSIFPSPNISTACVEHYNSILANASFGDDIDIMLCVDNQALYNLCNNQMKIKKPTYVNINRRISQIVSSLLTSYRFPGSFTANLSIFQTNLVPFRDLHYPLISYSSFSRHNGAYTIKQITSQCFDIDAQAMSVNPEMGKYISCCLLYRGKYCSAAKINSALQYMKSNKRIRFVDWCPTNFRLGINSNMPGHVTQCDIDSLDRALCCIAGHTGVGKSWNLLRNKFVSSYKRKAYLHWFKEVGIEDCAFEEAINIIDKVINRHKEAEGQNTDTSSNVTYKKLNLYDKKLPKRTINTQNNSLVSNIFSSYTFGNIKLNNIRSLLNENFVTKSLFNKKKYTSNKTSNLHFLSRFKRSDLCHNEIDTSSFKNLTSTKFYLEHNTPNLIEKSILKSNPTVLDSSNNFNKLKSNTTLNENISQIQVDLTDTEYSFSNLYKLRKKRRKQRRLNILNTSCYSKSMFNMDLFDNTSIVDSAIQELLHSSNL